MIIVIALFVALGFVWGSLNAMQKNYGLQKDLDEKQKELTIDQLENKNLQLEGLYYQTDEYKELAARRDVGLAKNGEKLLILPNNTDLALQIDKKTSNTVSRQTTNQKNESNIQKWINFLF
jgi:hypothetical protein